MVTQPELAAASSTPTTRLARLKERALLTPPSLCAERAVLVTQVAAQWQSHPSVRRRAESVAAVLRQMTVLIDDEELIVGNQASVMRAAPVFPEYAVQWLLDELDELPERSADPFRVEPGAKADLQGVAAWWQGRTLEDRVMATLPAEVGRAWHDSKTFNLTSLFSSGPAHLVVDYPTVLQEGLVGVMGRAERELSWLDLASPEDLRKRPFLESVLVMGQATIDFARRYAALARVQAQTASSEERRRELLEIAEVCERVPALPARSFRQAVQSLWFLQLVLQIESSGHSLSLGRIDQYLYPYYHEDVSSGHLTDAEATELLACLWIKLFWVNKVRPMASTRFAAGYPTYQNATIGGQTPDGEDATNALTYLCLDAVNATRLPTPNFSARYHHRSPERYLTACADLISRGFGMPAMENDEAIIPSFLARGVSLRDAHNYAMVGCVEAAVPGRWGYRCNGMTFLNLMKVFELALHGGREPSSGVCLLPGTGDLSTFRSFEELMGAWRRQLAYYTRMTVAGDAVIDAGLEDLVPDPLCSALVQDCIARGKTINEGGAIYDMVSGSQIGLANLANSLAAIKKLVFDEGRLTGHDLLAALQRNFSQPGDEGMRQMLLAAPKYGNDDDYVDRLGVAAYSDFLREIEHYCNGRFGRGPIGGTYFSSTSTVSSNVPAGMVIGATPDGRRAGESLAEGSSPHMGTDVHGPTATIRSVAKMPSLEITGGQLLNLKFAPAEVEGPGLRRLVALLRGFAELRGWHVQFNVISAATLRAAQEHPEQYRSLMVRVAGYCALFVTLDRATQDNIIRRTEHTLKK